MPREPGGIFVTSLYGYLSDQPLVRLVVADADPNAPSIVEIDMPPGKARGIAMSLLEAAEGATSDAFLIRWSRELHGEATAKEKEQGAFMGLALVRELRSFRELARRAGEEQEAADEQKWADEHP